MTGHQSCQPKSVQAPLPWAATNNSWQHTTIYDAGGHAICRLDLEDWGVTEKNQDRLAKGQAEVASMIVEAVNNQAVEAWRPFSTAPKDGTPILCFHPDDVFSPITGIDLIWWEPSEKIWTMDGDNPVSFVAKPSHWRPLPTPPQSSRAARTAGKS